MGCAAGCVECGCCEGDDQGPRRNHLDLTIYVEVPLL